MPSVSSDANASASACAQSIGTDAFWRERLAPALQLFDELGVDGEALGHPQQLLAQLAQPGGRNRGVDVGARRAVELVLARAVLVAVCSAAAAIFAFSRWCRIVRLSQTSCAWRSTSSLETTPSATSRSAHSSATRFLVLIFAYISGWV